MSKVRKEAAKKKVVTSEPARINCLFLPICALHLDAIATCSRNLLHYKDHQADLSHSTQLHSRFETQNAGP